MKMSKDGRTNVGHGGRSGRGGRRGLSDHEAARGWGQISIQTNTSGTRYETNATITSDTGVQKSIWTNTSGTRYETNATMSSDTRVQKTIRTNTSGTCSETNTWVRKSIGTNTSGIRSETNTTMSSDTLVQKTIRTNTSGTRSKTNTEVQKSIGTNTSGTRSETNATMSSDTRAQEPVGDDEPNTDELFKWEGLSDVLVHNAWENSMKKRYPDIMSKARGESVKLAKEAGVQFEGADWVLISLSHDTRKWIKSKHWEDMIDRVWKTEKWLNKAVSGSKNRNTMKEGCVSKHCAGSITISQHKRKFEQVHKRPPIAAELFELTHMKNGAFITLKSERVAAAYNVALVEKYGSEPANHPIYDGDLWKQCARDDKKGGVFGWGSMSDPQYTMTGTPNTTRCTGAPSGSKDVQNFWNAITDGSALLFRRNQ
ncbi:transposase, Ptta/En/Spm [Tanacetum coccineum]